MKNPLVDAYLVDGCGRCALAATPQCKVNRWTKELVKLRKIVLSCGLNEELKWGVPCYTHNARNISIVAAFKDYCSISFFKGALLVDKHGCLEKPGDNSQAVRLIRVTSLRQVAELEAAICDFVTQAIALEENGAKVEFKAKDELQLPVELEQKFTQLPALRAAFESLTPGRRRGYVLYFNGAKQSATKIARIEKCMPQILEGRGLHD